MSHLTTRREFLNNIALVSAAGVAPQFLSRTADAAGANIEGFKDDRVLVVVQLGGGNDGLNTLVPFEDDAYHRARPKIRLEKKDIHKLDDGTAFNAKLVDFMRLHDAGKLAVLQGVGYPNPDRSHFRSMEIWHTASRANEYLGTGWIGRYFDHNCSGTARPQVGVAVDKDRPQAFGSEQGFGIAFQNPYQFGWEQGKHGDSQENFALLNEPQQSQEGTLDFLRNVTTNAITSSEEVRKAAQRAKIRVKGGQPLGPALQTVAGLIRGGLHTRIYYVSVSGFDTHANQRGQQDRLLAGVGASIASFQKSLEADGLSGRVLTMVFSEFGRRVQENASGGTDHGTAAPMFFIGDSVKAGLHGSAPSLTNLDQGDLIHTTDFRSAYATVLEKWFQVDAPNILGGSFDTLDLLV